MPLFGKIVVIKRNGSDGTHFPLTINSCLFGRKKECDIRIQLPQVSKEHCKIEVNENKEVILINLSSVNPTQLNGSSFQDPAILKHGDVLTIIDRSFRFEYPPLSYPRKSLSRSQEKEALQILHIQKVEQEELLHIQNSECESPHIPGNLEWESKSNDNAKIRTPEHITGQHGALESTYKVCKSERKNEMSPFSKLYELMKHEGGTKTAEEDVSNETCIVQRGYSSRKDDNILLEVASHTSCRRSAADQAKKMETLILKKKTEHSGDTKNQVMHSLKSNPISFEENSSFADLQSYTIKQKHKSEGTNQLQFHDTQENVLEKSEVINSSNDANDSFFRTNKQNGKYFPESCCIVSLDYADNVNCPEKIVEQPTGMMADVEIKTNLTDTFGPVETVVPTPKPNRESFHANLNSCYRNTRSSSNLQVELDSLIDMKSSTESSAVIEKCSMHVGTGEHEYDLLFENKYSKIKGNNQMLATEPTQTLKEMRNESCANYATKDGRNITNSLYRSNQKSLRRSIKQNKDISNGRSFIQEIPTEGPDSSATGRITPKQLYSENGGNWLQEEDTIKGPTTKGHEHHTDMKNIAVLFNISESGHKSTGQIRAGNEAILEMNMSNPFSVKRKSEVKKSPQKRKGKEPDLLNQPLGKRKRVSFGGHLSPELFDKRLPPNSPLKRGAIPARLSLPFGNSPRAVLKKVSGVRHSLMKGFSEKEQDMNLLPQKSASSPARRSLPASPPVLISCKKLQSQGQFSVSHVTSPSCLEEQDAIATQVHINKEFAIKIPEPTEEEPKPTGSIRRSQQFASRRSSLRRRSIAMDAIHCRRRSGASEANLIVAKSWADVVKQGVPKPQVRSTTKCSLQRLTKKVLAKPSKNNVSSLKTPTRKVKGHFTTGHVNSPAPIVIGKAHTSVVNVAAQVPKVMFNYPLKQLCDLDESFTGMAEMFNTPLNGKPKSSLSPAQRMKTPESDVTSKIHTSEESGDMSILPVSLSNQQILYNQDEVSPLLKEVSQISMLEQDDLQIIPEEANTILEEIVRKNRSVTTENEMIVEEQDKSHRQTLEPIKMLFGVKQCLKISNESGEPFEALSGVKQLLRTPKQKPEPIEALSGVKRLLRTPKQKHEPVEALSGIKRLLRTPKQKPEPVEALSGVKRLLRTPKQKPEPVEALSGIKRLLRTPKQKPEPVEALSGVKRLLRTPKQKPEPVEALSGVKRLLRTPKQKPEPVEALSGVKRLLRTPKQEESVADNIICSKLLETRGEAIEELMGNATEKKQRMRLMRSRDVNNIKEPKERLKTVEDMEGIQRLLRTPKEKFKPMEDMVGVSRLLKTPKQNFMPIDDYLGLQKFMAEPKRNYFSPEIDYTGIKEMFDHANEYKDELPKLMNLMEEENGSCMNSRNELECREIVSKDEEVKLEDSHARKSPSTLQRDNSKNDPKLEHSLEHVPCYSFSELKTQAETESIETIYVPESCQSDGVEPPNGAKVDFVKEPVANPDAVDLEMFEPLTSPKRNKKRKADEFTFIGEYDRNKIYKRHTSRIKSIDFVQTNGIFDQNITQISPVQKFEGNVSEAKTEVKRSSQAKFSKTTDETNGNVQSDSIIHIQELLRSSKETSVKKQTCVNRRRMATKRTGQAGTRLHSEKNEETQENGYKLIRKTRNGEDKNDLKSEFTKINSQDKIQNQDFETSGVESTGNSLLKRNRRGKATPTPRLNTTINEYKYGIQECTASKTSKLEILENNLTEVKENTVKRGKGKKVHFLLEKRKSVSFEEKCVLVDKDGAHKEERITFFESSISSAKENTRSRRKAASVASQPVCISLSKGKHSLEISEGINFSFEHREKCVQKIKIEKSCKETQKVLLGPSRRQKVVNENPPKRGRRKQVIFHEMHTEHDSKQAADIKDQYMVVSVEQNQPKRRKGRSVVPVFQIPVPLEDMVLAKEEPTMDIFGSAQGKCTLQQIQKEKNPNETHKVPLESVETPAEHTSPRRQKVAKENPPRRGRRKQVLSHETSTEHDSKPAADIKDQSMAVTVKENQPKRGRGKSMVPIFQMPLENIALAEEEPTASAPRRGRSKQAISHEISTECDSKQAADIKDQYMVVSVEQNQPKQRRGRSVVPVFQIPVPLEDIVLAKEEPMMGIFGSAQGKCTLQQIQKEENPNETQKVPLESVETPAEHTSPRRQKVAKENPPRRGRRKQVVSHEISTQHDSKPAADIKDQSMAVTVKESQPKRGRGKSMVPIFQMPLENIALAEEEPTASAPRRGRSKQAISHEISTECDSKQAADIKDQNMVLKIACSERESQSKRGRRRNIASVSHTLLSPLKNNILSLPASTKGKSAVEQPRNPLETATTANETLPHRGRRRKTDDIIATSLVSACKKSRLLANQENMPKDVQIMTQENVSKRGRRKQSIPYKTSTESNWQLENDSKKTAPVKDKRVFLGHDFGKENHSKKRGEGIVLASEVPSLKLNITLPQSQSDNGETVSGNPSVLTENEAFGKGRITKCERKDNKIVARATSVRKCKLPEEGFQEKQNVVLEKTIVTNEKQQRNGRRKAGSVETTNSASNKNCGLTSSSDIAPKNQMVILDNTVSDKKDASKSRRLKSYKGKQMLKNTDQTNTSNNDQNSYLELLNPPEQKNLAKRGRREQVSSNSRDATSDITKSLFPNQESLKQRTQKIQQQKRKKMKEQHTTAMVEPAAETEGKTRASKRNR